MISVKRLVGPVVRVPVWYLLRMSGEKEPGRQVTPGHPPARPKSVYCVAVMQLLSPEEGCFYSGGHLPAGFCAIPACLCTALTVIVLMFFAFLSTGLAQVGTS